MALEDTSTSVEKKASDFPKQQQIVHHWEKFAKCANGKITGEFNVFQVVAKVEIPLSDGLIIIQGYRQQTDYWAGGASMWIKQKRIYEENTSIKYNFRSDSKFKIKFKIIKKSFLGNLTSRIRHGRSHSLNDKYMVYNANEKTCEFLTQIEIDNIFKQYLDYNLRITVDTNQGLVELKFHKMLLRSNEILNLLNQFSEFLKRLNI